jgi:predicted metal-binding membrane protein
MNIPVEAFPAVFGAGAVLGMLVVAGWVFTTWLKIRHGYPLENSWGKAVYPRTSDETIERVKLLSAENAQLRAELSAVKERLGTVERIVTDGSYRLDREIDALRGAAN